MCLLQKLSPDCKRENAIYTKQIQELALYFSNIEDTKIRNKAIFFMKKISKMAENKNNNDKINKLISEDKNTLKKICNTDEENLPYIAMFSRCINKIDSIALKDQMIELVRTLVVKRYDR